MPYATYAEFEQAFGRNETEDLLTNGSDFLKAEANASGIIDVFIGTRYVLPLFLVPTAVRQWSLDITRYLLWDKEAPQTVKDRYEKALEQLELLAKGIITLPTTTIIPDTDATGITGYSDERIFTQINLVDY